MIAWLKGVFGSCEQCEEKQLDADLDADLGAIPQWEDASCKN